MITGIDAVVFGADDFEAGRKFLRDWGLNEAENAPDELRFLTRDRSEVIVRKSDSALLPPTAGQAPTLREVIWGLENEAALKALESRLDRDEARDSEGCLAIRDVDGFTHTFRVTRRTPVAAAGQDSNGPGLHQRVDRRSHVYREAKPIGIGHVVLWSGDFERAAKFYKEDLGFVESDRIKGFGVFLRASTPGPHHNIFLLNRPEKPGVDHVAFTVDNYLEVLGGGLAMERKGWSTRFGPGFHPVSSAFFWYLNSPLGAQLEYYADDDYCTEAWQPKEFQFSPELYTDWAVTGFHKQVGGGHH